MAGVRDPAFWKRFSVAVHLDEEEGAHEVKYSDTWLGRQKKKSGRYFVCWVFWPCMFIFIAAVIAVIIWLLNSGILNKVEIGNGSAPSQPANPNSSVQDS